jgi:abelson tyrosine-protein kinase 1
LDEKVGIGFFADVYRGLWRQRIVAIKVLARSTPRSLFIHEAAIWKTLKHPNVLELYGASSASREGPWFFVSRFCRGGNLVKYLKSVEEELWRSAVGPIGPGNAGLEPGGGLGKGVDLVRMMWEIARGMQYLHSNGVLHGDLKVRIVPSSKEMNH